MHIIYIPLYHNIWLEDRRLLDHKIIVMETNNPLPLHHSHVHKLWSSLNKTYSLLNIISIIFIFYYRSCFYLNQTNSIYPTNIPSWTWILLFISELILSFIWLLRQPVFWRPVTRTALPERLPGDEKLPGVDVFICTADHVKEPPFEVMNTVVSAMCLDYPTKKLSVYLSDDGAAFVTLNGLKDAWVFATWWLPFVTKYNVKPPCPMAFFDHQIDVPSYNNEFLQEREIIKEKYEVFKRRVKTKMRGGEIEEYENTSNRDHPALIQVIDESCIDEKSITNSDATDMPLLVYVAREKRPSYPHNFKAGALNVLLRISSTLSNSPYVLVLDCDMYCNDTSSAREAMCFHLDPKISPSLGWVQFPQKFHNIHEPDVYDSQMRTLWPVLWRGTNGLQGPIISGTNFYIKREALYGIDACNGNNLMELRDTFDPSIDLIKSTSQFYKSGELSSTFLQEAKSLASCTYEKDTKWGEKVGFQYGTIVEDVKTAFYLQHKGWRSVFLNPTRPQFLGSATINLNDLLTQGIRWYSGILGVGLSKYSPFIYTPSKSQFLNKMFNSWIGFFVLETIPDFCFATIPPLCFLYGIPLYPKVSNSLFVPFSFTMISSLVKHLCEVYISGGSTRSWANEQRIAMVKAITCYLYGTLDCLMTKLEIQEANFTPTNKVEDDDKTKYYMMGKYDFRTSNMFLIPLVTLVMLNMCCFIGGIARLMVAHNWDQMFAQLVLSFYLFVMSFPVIDGALLRTDHGRVPSSATFISILVSLLLLILGYFSLLY